jgi:UDP-GlcNAc:undecaprenyl-phosphate/decaprenyl-phosphate GlcNAc-1-phosphate transferase
MDLLAFVVAMVVTMALIPPLMRSAARLNVLDDPASRKVHSTPIPRVGGIAMGIGSLLPLCLWLQIDRMLTAYLLAVAVLLAFGAWDDRVSLGALPKFAGQLIAVLIVVLVGHVSIDELTLGTPILLPEAVSFTLSVLFLLGVTNAINLADGLDGLAGGMALLCCAALALLSGSWGAHRVETIAVVLMGALLGFLRFNTYPARVFMGDAGSQFLGLSIGVLSILLTKNDATPFSTALPLLLIGLPLLDTLIVMVRRLRAGRSPFVADRTHFHHRLLDLGLDHYEAVVVIYTAQCLLLLLGWQLRLESDLLIISAFLGFAILFTATLLWLEHTGWRWRTVADPSRSPLRRLSVWLGARDHLPRWSLRLACLCAVIYLLGVASYTDPASRDVGWLGGVGVLVLAIGRLWQRSTFAQTWLSRGALYVAVMAAVYLDHATIDNSAALEAVKWTILPLLAVSVAVATRLSGDRRFEATPLDLLLIFAAFALPNLPGLAGTPHDFGLSAAKLVVMFYAVELVGSIGSRLRTVLLGATAAFYVVVAFRALG